MDYLLNAKYIGIEDDEYAFVLGFADDEFEPQKYVMLQRGLEQDEQDLVLEMDKIHIEIEDQSRSGYGGVAALRCSEDVLRIELTSHGKKFLKIDGDVIIQFSCDHSIITKWVERLHVTLHVHPRIAV